MSNSIPSFSEAEIRKVLGSPEGKMLLQLLGQNGGTALRQAADAVKRGDTAAAQEIMRPLMESPAIAALVNKINQK